MKKLALLVMDLLVSLSAFSAANEFVKSGSLIYEEDNEFYFRNFGEDFMTHKALEDYVGNLAGGKVTHFFMNANGQRTSYRTKVSEAVCDPLKHDKKFPEIEWTRSCRKLFERDIDPYAVWTRKCREIGVSPWISMRMNDIHFVDNPNSHPRRARILDFWRDHPEFHRKNSDKIGILPDAAFDFSHAEVRAYQLALVREFLENWDVDGINLDWMRSPLCLTPNKEREQAHLLTEFMREVRKTANEFAEKRGHKIGIAVRVPIKPSRCFEIGLDAAEWTKLGYIDVLIISPYYQTYFNMPVPEWKAVLGDAAKNVAIVTAADHGFAPYPCSELRDPPRARRGDMTLPYCTGWAESCWYKGADAVYFYNLMYSPQSWYSVIRTGVSKSKTRNAPRRHPVSYIDDDIMLYQKVQALPDTDVQLPQTTDESEAAVFKIQMGRAPKDGSLSAIVGFESATGMADASFKAALNGVDSDGYSVVFTPYEYGKSKYALRFKFPLAAAKNGVNSFSIQGTPARIVWVEIQCE